MSFIKHPIFLIGLVCIVLGSGCLLSVYIHDRRMSDTIHELHTVSSVSGNIASTSSKNTSIPSTSQPVATTTVVSTHPATTTPPSMTFEIVTTQAAQNRGLGGRSVIPDNYAMLFVFPADSSPGFWMKDMLTSIDMIWLSDNGTIVSINPSVSPGTYPTVFYSPSPVHYVLETRAGFAVEKGWHVGTQVSLPLPLGRNPEALPY